MIFRGRDQEDRQEVGRFAKNYIPILLNLYFSVTLNKADKLAVYETLSHFFTLADAELVEAYFDKAFAWCEKEPDVNKKSLYLDVLRLLVCRLPNEQKVIATFEAALVAASNNQHSKEQKKSFRMIEELLKSPNCNLLQKHYSTQGQDLYQIVVKFFEEKYSSIQVLSSQASLVRIVDHALTSKYAETQISIEDFQRFVASLVHILQAKKSAKLRQSTFAILYTLIRCCENGPVRCVEALVQQLRVESNQFDRKATILYMLHNILLQYHEKIDQTTKTVLIKSLLANFDVENRKMVTTILVFIKDWFRVCTKDELLPFISLFIDYLNGIARPDSAEYKYKIKNIVERLLKKYGHEIVIKLIDRKYHPLVKSMEKHIRTEKNEKLDRKGKRPTEYEDSEDEDDDDDQDGAQHGDSKRKKSSKRWRFDEEDQREGLQLLQEKDLDNEMEDDDDEQRQQHGRPEVLSKGHRKSLSFAGPDEIIRIDEEGNIVERSNRAPVASGSGDAEVKMDIESDLLPAVNRKASRPQDSDDDDCESADDQDAEVDQKRNKSANKSANDKPMAARIMDKYRRKRGIRRDTTVTGEQYRSSRARGDMKKPGIPDPYAYLPLNRSTLNKRKTNKNQKQFKNLVKAAVKGARKSRY